MLTPKVSIVTPSYNHGRFLVATLDSVRQQDYANIEHIVIDGGSTDDTLEILQRAPGIQWCSEPDRGQVDALNKGFAKARGEILAWLCSDDTLSPNAVRTAVLALQQSDADLVYGQGEIIDERGRFLGLARVTPFEFRSLLCCNNWIPQPTVFFRRQLWERGGPLRLEFDNAFDYELWLRYSHHGRFAFVPEIRAQLRAHPAAKTVARPGVTLGDYDRIRAAYWPRGGLPSFLQHKPWFLAVHYFYRLKRRWRWYRQRRQSNHPTGP